MILEQIDPNTRIVITRFYLPVLASAYRLQRKRCHDIWKTPISNQIQQPVLIEKIGEQVLVRLIMSGMYPIRKQDNSGWLYFKSEKEEYVGTPKSEDFEKYWTETLYFLGQGQMSSEQIEECKKVDYLLTEKYMNRFEKWKIKMRWQWEKY